MSRCEQLEMMWCDAMCRPSDVVKVAISYQKAFVMATNVSLLSEAATTRSYILVLKQLHMLLFDEFSGVYTCCKHF